MPVAEGRSEEPEENGETNEIEEDAAEKEEESLPDCEPPTGPPAVPKHLPSPPPPPPPPPPISSAKGSPPVGLPLTRAKGKAPPPPFLMASAKGKAPLPSPPGMKNGKAPPPTPLKAAIKMGPPVAPLRPLFWTSVPMGPRDRLQNNFWKSVKQGSKLIDEDTIPWCAEYVDENELQATFGQNATKASSSKLSSGRPGSAPALHRRKVLKLLDDKRSHILAIAFRPLPSPDKLLHIIASGDVSALTGAQLTMLADEVPTPDEAEELAAMEIRAEQEGNTALWDTPEQYLVALSSAKDTKSVLKAWAFGANVRDGLLSDARDQLEALNAACQAMKESKELVDLVRVMLSIGNRVNANTARGGAEILSMDSLLRFDNVRSPCDTSMTLLKYCVQTWKKKNGRSPSMISMLTKMLRPVTHPKTKIPDIKEIDKDVKRIAGLSREAKTLLECLRQEPNYESEVIPLVEEGMRRADELQDYLKKTMASWKSTLEYFCVKNESPLAEKSDEFFEVMKSFIQLVGNYAATD
ncbi:hypothetical protein FOL47_009407 [Perkinsus chesapeaki]|uniref:FH2 domain-containing protein n=1 Tax=Perkinsus chesapeaki TaxID=330153 RepID=A0A7J6L8H9_PERCH|nr:hypothetical protein FOL47_009407 [Perkinsus chesapeaki]